MRYNQSRNDIVMKHKRRHTHRHSYNITFNHDDSVITGVCPICGQNTYYDPSNIIVGNNIYHFDCVSNWVKEHFGVDEDKKIYYIGSRVFGIFWESKDGKKVEILRRVSLEEHLNVYGR